MQNFLLKSSSFLRQPRMVNQAMATMTRFQKFSVCAKRFPNEPERPVMLTTFPGPVVKETIAAYGETSCNQQVMFHVDL